MITSTRLSFRTVPKNSSTKNTAPLPTAATKKLPTPQQMPTMMDQKRYMVSRESLMAVRKRTMDRAPTMPRDRAMLLPMTIITVPVSTAKMTRLTLNFRL